MWSTKEMARPACSEFGPSQCDRDSRARSSFFCRFAFTILGSPFWSGGWSGHTQVIYNRSRVYNGLGIFLGKSLPPFALLNYLLLSALLFPRLNFAAIHFRFLSCLLVFYLSLILPSIFGFYRIVFAKTELHYLQWIPLILTLMSYPSFLLLLLLPQMYHRNNHYLLRQCPQRCQCRRRYHLPPASTAMAVVAAVVVVKSE